MVRLTPAEQSHCEQVTEVNVNAICMKERAGRQGASMDFEGGEEREEEDEEDEGEEEEETECEIEEVAGSGLMCQVGQFGC